MRFAAASTEIRVAGECHASGAYGAPAGVAIQPEERQPEERQPEDSRQRATQPAKQPENAIKAPNGTITTTSEVTNLLRSRKGRFDVG